MDYETLAFRRILDRFGKTAQKAVHLSHRGKVRSDVGDDGIRIYELDCDCGCTLGAWRDV